MAIADPPRATPEAPVLEPPVDTRTPIQRAVADMRALNPELFRGEYACLTQQIARASGLGACVVEFQTRYGGDLRDMREFVTNLYENTATMDNGARGHAEAIELAEKLANIYDTAAR